MKPLEQLTGSDFRPYLNTTFTIQLEGLDPIPLELDRVTETSSKPWPDARQPFTLHFLGPVSQQYLLQHIYALDHPAMGRLELFLVPLGPEAGRMRYEAVFS